MGMYMSRDEIETVKRIAENTGSDAWEMQGILSALNADTPFYRFDSICEFGSIELGNEFLGDRCLFWQYGRNENDSDQCRYTWRIASHEGFSGLNALSFIAELRTQRQQLQALADASMLTGGFIELATIYEIQANEINRLIDNLYASGLHMA